jgi:ribosomal protein S18 acetylase RimI-like enzyme
MNIQTYNKDSIQNLSPSFKGQIILLDQSLEELRWSKKVWAETWEEFNHFLLQTYINNDQVLAFGLWTLPPMEDVMHLLKIVVSPLEKGKGIAGLLFEDMLKTYPSKGVYLEVKTSNSTAVKFYQKHGLRILTQTRNYYGIGVDAYKMFKPALPND